MRANPAYVNEFLEENQRLAAELRKSCAELKAKDKVIAEKNEDIAFLKYALALALEGKNGGRVVIRDKKHDDPEFKLEENLSGEMIVCLVRN